MTNEQENEIELKGIDTMLIATKKFLYFGSKDDLSRPFKELEGSCGKSVCGPPFMMMDWGRKEERGGLVVEACFPVEKEVVHDGVGSRFFTGGEAFSLRYSGPYDRMDDSYAKIFGYAHSHGVQPGMNFLEVYPKGLPNGSSDDDVELVMMLHPWFSLLFESVDLVLGKEVSEKVLDRLKAITPTSSMEDRFGLVMETLKGMGEYANDEQQYEILSRCADFFSRERIGEMRDVFHKRQNVDDVLEYLRDDIDWIIKPWREGREVHIIKVPYRRKKYDEAKTAEERRRHYCHCPIVRDRLDGGMPPSFCYCGTGWVRQQWEGILGMPVKVTVARSLLNGDDVCELVVHMPDEIVVD